MTIIRSIVFSILALTILSASTSAESVRILRDLDNVESAFSISNDASSIILSLDIPAIAISAVDMNSTEYKRVDLPTAEYLFPAETSGEGKPDIPILTAMLAIPDYAGVRLEVTHSGYDVVQNIDLAPVQPSPCDTALWQEIPFTIDMDTYGKDAFYPGELARAADPVIMRDVRGVQVELCPIQFNPVTRELRIYRNLSVNVSYDGEPVNPKMIRRPYLSDGFYQLYKTTFANFDQVFFQAEVKRGGYVIICKAAAADSLKKVAMWKHQKGYTTRIVPTTEINPSGTPTNIQVFNYIRNAYQTWETPPEYVMLAGDVSGYLGVPDYSYEGYDSDHKYACVDGNDYLPDLFVARLSVDNISQLRVAMAKILKYEKKPLMSDPEHWTRGLSVGYTAYSTARLTTLWVRELALRHGFSRVDTIYGTSEDPRLTAYMNSGPSYIWYRGMGGYNGWWGVSYSVTELQAMPNNQKLGVMSPLTCGLGAFGWDNCFGEVWISMGLSPDSLKGGPAFYGVSDGGTHTKWNNPIMIGYFFGIFEQDIYHFAAAAVAGKLQDYRTFPNNRDDWVQQYFHTYNMLGDPELELRTKIPILISVAHPETLAFGLNHIEITVEDRAGDPVPGAFVTLIKMDDTNEDVYSIEKTDEGGNAELAFDAPTPGTMTLTVSGRDLYPYEENVYLVTSPVAVGFDSLVIDDDLSGFSRGNGDSLVNPGETLELFIALKNYGDAVMAESVTTELMALDSGLVEVYDGAGVYGDLGPGQSLTNERPFLVRIDPGAGNDEIARLRQTITDQNNNSWFTVIELPVKAPCFAISEVRVFDENDWLEPGDTASIVIKVINRSQVDGLAVAAQVTSEDDFTTILDGAALFGDIPAGDTASSAGDSITIALALAAFPGRKVDLLLTMTTSAGAQSSVPFSINDNSVIETSDPTGPDAYGYYMYDSSDSSYTIHPTYEWVELAPGLGGQGTRLNFGSGSDDGSVKIDLPFDLVYYGDIYRSLIACTNGFVSPDTFRIDMGGNFWANFFNWPIPDPGCARAQISQFWDDLQISSTGNYGVFIWSDTVQHRYVIEWNHATHRNTAAIETFEMIIFDPAFHPTLTGDASILFQYNTIVNNDSEENHATVGCESWDQLTGVEYTHDNIYDQGAATLGPQKAILITTSTGRGAVEGGVILDNANDNSGARISSSSGQYRITADDGAYRLSNLSPGQISLKAEAGGYLPSVLRNLRVPADSLVSDVSFALTQCPVPENLRATDSLGTEIQINWDALTHPNLAGYNLYKSRWRTGGYEKINTQPLVSPSYIDLPQDSSIYWYRVCGMYADTDWVAESFASDPAWGSAYGAIGIDENDAAIPGEFFLSQNYPNPFNPATAISYGLPVAAHIKIEIFNLLGQRVLTLFDGQQTAGYKSAVWDGRDRSGKSVASGVYLCRLTAGDKVMTRKMSLLK